MNPMTQPISSVREMRMICDMLTFQKNNLTVTTCVFWMRMITTAMITIVAVMIFGFMMQSFLPPRLHPVKELA